MQSSDLELYALHNTRQLLLYCEHYRNCTHKKNKINRCPPVRAQTSLILSIPNYPPVRQGKSLDYVLARVVDKIMKKRRKANRTLLVNFLYCHNVSDQSHQLIIAPRAAHGSPQNASIFASCKMPEFFEKSTLSGAGKHPDFQVTSCHHFDTTDPNFAYIESE